jgi:hypothetical protein
MLEVLIWGSLNPTTLHDRSQSAIHSQKNTEKFRAGLGIVESRATALAKKDVPRIAAMTPFQYHSDVSSGFGAQTTSTQLVQFDHFMTILIENPVLLEWRHCFQSIFQ